MNAVFQLASPPEVADAQRISEALDRQRGVVTALVDPRQAKVFVTFDPDLTGDLALQRVIEDQGYRVAGEGEPVGFTTETPGYLQELDEETRSLGQATALTRDAEFRLPDRE